MEKGTVGMSLCCDFHRKEGFQGGTMVKNPPASAGNARDTVSVPGWGRSPGGGNSNQLQYSCLENHRDRVASKQGKQVED